MVKRRPRVLRKRLVTNGPATAVNEVMALKRPDSVVEKLKNCEMLVNVGDGKAIAIPSESEPRRIMEICRKDREKMMRMKETAIVLLLPIADILFMSHF